LGVLFRVAWGWRSPSEIKNLRPIKISRRGPLVRALRKHRDGFLFRAFEKNVVKPSSAKSRCTGTDNGQSQMKDLKSIKNSQTAEREKRVPLLKSSSSVSSLHNSLKHDGATILDASYLNTVEAQR
jgi:hypothetical protein